MIWGRDCVIIVELRSWSISRCLNMFLTNAPPMLTCALREWGRHQTPVFPESRLPAVKHNNAICVYQRRSGVNTPMLSLLPWKIQYILNTQVWGAGLLELWWLTRTSGGSFHSCHVLCYVRSSRCISSVNENMSGEFTSGIWPIHYYILFHQTTQSSPAQISIQMNMLTPCWPGSHILLKVSNQNPQNSLVLNQQKKTYLSLSPSWISRSMM
jgi:hypothetical protein